MIIYISVNLKINIYIYNLRSEQQQGQRLFNRPSQCTNECVAYTLAHKHTHSSGDGNCNNLFDALQPQNYVPISY